MNKSFWPKGLKLNIHAPGTGAALMVLALTQLPVALESFTNLACVYGPEKLVGAWINSRPYAPIDSFREKLRLCNGGSAYLR